MVDLVFLEDRLGLLVLVDRAGQADLEYLERGMHTICKEPVFSSNEQKTHLIITLIKKDNLVISLPKDICSIKKTS